MAAKDYDTTVARIAGNILSGNWPQSVTNAEEALEWAVRLARGVVAEVKRTEAKA